MGLNKFIKQFLGSKTTTALPPSQQSERRQWISNPWHAVSIVSSQPVCRKARGLYRARFLSKDAPPLPLAGCDARICGCHYRHHEDRRRALRRASDGVSKSTSWAGLERRLSAERRSTDSRGPA